MKHLNRFLCFFMCFCLCFAWFGPPIEAEAVGIGYALYVLIIWMASFGVSFVGSDIAEIWDHALEDWVRDYIEYREDLTIDDFYDGIMKDVVVNNQGYIVVGVTAASLMSDFMAWLRDVKMVVPGNSVGFRYGTAYFYPNQVYLVKNGIQETLYLISSGEGDAVVTKAVSDYEPKSFVNLGSALYPGDTAYWDYYSGYFKSKTKYTVVYTLDGKLSYQAKDSSSVFTVDLSSVASKYGYSLSDVLCISFMFTNGSLSEPSHVRSLVPCLVFKDGMAKSISPTFFTFDYSVYDKMVTSQVSEGSVEVDDDGFKIPDPSSWPVGFSGYTMNTGDISGSTIGDIANQIDQQLEIGDLTVSPELNTVETDGSSQGTLMGIFNLLKALPQTLANLILDGIKSIFIPDPEHMEAQFMGLLDEINEKYAFDFDLDSLFSNSKEPDDIVAVYTVGSKNIEMTFVAWYYLKNAVEYFRPFIRGFIILMLIFYNLRQFASLFGIGGVLNAVTGEVPMALSGVGVSSGD